MRRAKGLACLPWHARRRAAPFADSCDATTRIDGRGRPGHDHEQQTAGPGRHLVHSTVRGAPWLLLCCANSTSHLAHWKPCSAGHRARAGARRGGPDDGTAGAGAARRPRAVRRPPDAATPRVPSARGRAGRRGAAAASPPRRRHADPNETGSSGRRVRAAVARQGLACDRDDRPR